VVQSPSGAGPCQLPVATKIADLLLPDDADDAALQDKPAAATTYQGKPRSPEYLAVQVRDCCGGDYHCLTSRIRARTPRHHALLRPSGSRTPTHYIHEGACAAYPRGRLSFHPPDGVADRLTAVKNQLRLPTQTGDVSREHLFPFTPPTLSAWRLMRLRTEPVGTPPPCSLVAAFWPMLAHRALPFQGPALKTLVSAT
jgi:hypothetical protein